MSNYDIDKYALPNKWMADDFEKLQALIEKAQKEKEKKKDDYRGTYSKNHLSDR